MVKAMAFLDVIILLVKCLVLALATTSLSKVSGGFFRGVWLLPRMSRIHRSSRQ